MAQTKTVLKLDIACQKCKTKVLKAVTAIEGIFFFFFFSDIKLVGIRFHILIELQALFLILFWICKLILVLGVDKVETDEVKGTLAVTGTADPFDIVKRTRKAIACAGKVVDVVTIGPPPKPEEKKPDDKKPDNKKPDDKKPDDKKPDPPPVCPCPPYPPYYGSSYIVVPRETYPSCTIL